VNEFDPEFRSGRLVCADPPSLCINTRGDYQLFNTPTDACIMPSWPLPACFKTGARKSEWRKHANHREMLTRNASIDPCNEQEVALINHDFYCDHYGPISQLLGHVYDHK